MPTLAKTIFEVQRVFNVLNVQHFGGELTAPIFTVQSRGKKPALGWCSLRKIWRETKPENGASYYEINLCAESLTLDNEGLVHILLHEMVHLYCAQCGIKDTSRAGTYHNAKFKEQAEAHGLIVRDIDEKYGWAATALTSAVRDGIPALRINRRAFSVARVASKPGEKKKSSSRKYICPMCGIVVRATKDVNIRCTDCDADFWLESEC
jgi:hypothetical protein